MRSFDWHSDPIFRTTLVTPAYKNTQNVRRFLTREFNRAFMAWIINGEAKTMGDVADEWLRRKMSVSHTDR